MGTMTELFDTAVYAHRLAQAATLCRERGLAGLIIGTGPELAYLTGAEVTSHERLTALVVPSDAPPILVVPVTDQNELAASAIPQLPVQVLGWTDGENAHHLAVTALPDHGPVGLGSSLTADHVLTLQALLPERETVLATATLRELFTRKDDAEINQLRAAGAAIDAVHAQVPQLLVAGRTEEQVAGQLAELILTEHTAVDFVIVGSGPNGADPHHSFSPRTLKNGDPVVIDIGGTLPSGYHSDCTRTYVVGGKQHLAPERFRHAHALLERAHTAAITAIRPGVRACDIDHTARDIITRAGYGRHFIHRTGHGIGLSTHEEPFIMAGNDLILEEGMVFSVEPGIYLPGEWGMRIEDIITVTATGAQLLNLQPKTLG